jgi:hypothetical protein
MTPLGALNRRARVCPHGVTFCFSREWWSYRRLAAEVDRATQAMLARGVQVVLDGKRATTWAGDRGPAGFVGLCDGRGRSCWPRNVGLGNPDALGRAGAVPHPDQDRLVRARRQGIETALALKTIMPAMSMVAALPAAHSDERQKRGPQAQQLIAKLWKLYLRRIGKRRPALR